MTGVNVTGRTAQRVPENPSVNHVLLTRMGVSADHVRHTPRLVRTLSTRVPKLDLFVNIIEPTIFQKSAQGVNNGVMHQRLSPLPLGTITLVVIPVKVRTHATTSMAARTHAVTSSTIGAYSAHEGAASSTPRSWTSILHADSTHA